MKRPLVLAHRGANNVSPENTLPAFRKAVELGADGVELDVQRTADDALVIFHDERLERTTNGSGRVTEHTLAEIRALDAGAWFGNEWAGEHVPTLDEVFDALPENAVVNVELKRQAWRSDGLERAFVAWLAQRTRRQTVLVSSFNPALLWRLRRTLPHLPLGFLYGPEKPRWPCRLWMRSAFPFDALHPHDSLVTPQLVDWAHRRGLRVHVWTVNDPERARELAGMEVDAIITDVPDVIAGALPG